MNIVKRTLDNLSVALVIFAGTMICICTTLIELDKLSNIVGLLVGVAMGPLLIFLAVQHVVRRKRLLGVRDEVQLLIGVALMCYCVMALIVGLTKEWSFIIVSLMSLWLGVNCCNLDKDILK